MFCLSPTKTFRPLKRFYNSLGSCIFYYPSIHITADQNIIAASKYKIIMVLFNYLFFQYSDSNIQYLTFSIAPYLVIALQSL